MHFSKATIDGDGYYLPKAVQHKSVFCNPSQLASICSDLSTFTDRFRSVAPALQNEGCKKWKRALYKKGRFYVQFQPNSILLLSLCAAWQAFPDPVISLNMNLIDQRKGRQLEVNRNLSSKAQKRHPPNFDACSTAGEKYLAGGIIGRPSYSWVKRPSWFHTVDFQV